MRVAEIRLPEETVMLSNVHPERVEEDERERREVEREAVPVEKEKETRVRVSDPEERVMRDRLGTSKVAESIVKEIEEKVAVGPLMVKREEEMPVQLTGLLMPVPDVVIEPSVEKVTGAFSDECAPEASWRIREPEVTAC